MAARTVPPAVELDDAAAAKLVPARPVRGHKGTFGKLLVIAGSVDYAGAAFLVCTAAGRAGAGLVTLAVPESLQPMFAAKVVEATTMPLPEDDVEEVDPEPALSRVLDHDHDAIVVGPGLRPSLSMTELIRGLLCPGDDVETVPTVLDAEALRSLATIDNWSADVSTPCVLTPHVGEFLRLRAAEGHDPEKHGDLVADDGRRLWAARDAAREWGQVVVLKGARTVIAHPDGRAAVAPFENPAMASGGTGDVLAGTIGGLLSQHLEPFEAAQLGVYLHGMAGEAVRARIGDAGLLASDLTPELPLARRRLVALAGRR
jgi:ADP-dependent NAD(P)H-hydrate dehydratase / NAD(P)H-hydrate epimerase